MSTLYHPTPSGSAQPLSIVIQLALAVLIGGVAVTFIPVSDASAAGRVVSAKNTLKPLEADAVRILRADRLLIGKRDRFCVTSSANDAAVALVERSGEDLKTWTIESYANDTAIALIHALEYAGLPTEVAGSVFRDRVVLGSNPRTLAVCKSEAGTIFVSLEIKEVAGSGGYHAIVTARQGSRRFIAQIERQSLIVKPMEGRALIASDADSTPDGKPYWDVDHDLTKLKKALLIHLFGSD